MLTLGQLPIVATQTLRIGTGDLLGDLDDESDADGPTPGEQPRPVSGTKTYGILGKRWPIIATSPTSRRPAPSGRWDRLRLSPELPPVESEGPLEDMPARACTGCNYPLPADVDERTILTVAVVGLKGASKTHFLAAALHAATREQGLAGVLGCTEFAPDERTARQMHGGYFEDLRRTGRALAQTSAGNAAATRFEPLAFRATFPVWEPVTLLFHDLAGEIFSDAASRYRYASFLRRADALIFLIDPIRFPPVDAYVSREYGECAAPAPIGQADLVNAVAFDLRHREDLHRLPVAVALSKSDLLGPAIGRLFLFDKDPPEGRAAWFEDIYETGLEVQSLLLDPFGAHDLRAAVARFPDVTFHAVSPLGAQAKSIPGEERKLVDQLKPHRCLEPVFSVLRRLLTAPR